MLLLWINREEFMQHSEQLIDHEVRIRSIESKYDEIKEVFKNIDLKFNKLESKMDSQFHWVLGSIFTMIFTMLTLFGGIILHLAKLI